MSEERVALPFPDIRVGVGEDPSGPTGCTVIDFGGLVSLARDMRGGSVCWTGDYPQVHALCLSGGSVHGLEAVTGVTAGMLARRGNRIHWSDLPLVSGAAVYDFHGRDTHSYPTRELGLAALADAEHSGSQGVPVGRRGAGSCTQVGAGLDGLSPEPGGQEAAAAVEGDLTVAVITVVNSFGAVMDRTGAVVCGYLHEPTGRRYHAAERIHDNATSAPEGGNTTLTVVITDARLDTHSLTQLGRQVHSSMARVIDPFHTLFDGDILWSVTTGTGPGGVNVAALGTLAAEVAADAVLRAVTHPSVRTVPTDPLQDSS